MLLKLIAKIRGINRWPYAVATVTASELFSVPRSGDWNRISFYYRPAGAEIQSGTIQVDSLASMHALSKGDTFSLQFDPSRPDRFYCEDAQSATRTFQTIMAPLCLGVVLAIVVSAVLEALRR